VAERATARIDHGAIAANVSRLRAELRAGAGAGAELCVVVKAEAYGHGMVEVARTALDAGAGRLAVATAFEAERLAHELPGARLLTLGALREEGFEVALGAGSEVAIWNEETRAMAAARGRAMGRPAPVHVKLDSGMGRLGNMDPGEVIALAAACAADPDLELAGVWTHFATADDRGDDYFEQQLERFTAVAEAVRAEHPGVCMHAANSAAVLRDPRTHFDLVRCGIAVYGLDPFGVDPGDWDLRPALSLHTYVATVKHFTAGTSAGYSRTWRAPRDTWVAALPIGYGDGVRRSMSNNGEVLIAGARRPIVGNVSMDNITVDLGPETVVRPGDPAVLIGRQGGEEITAEAVAARLGTINYEVTTAISARVARQRAGNADAR